MRRPNLQTGRAGKQKSASRAAIKTAGRRNKPLDYCLDEQVGFLLRRANQRHTTIFAERMIEELTPTQWAALAKLHERGALSQNLLGRHTAMDAATIKGVVDRLTARGFTTGKPDPTDARRLRIALTTEGRGVVKRAISVALAITEETLRPLSATERKSLMWLLDKIK
jgi:DNA-binding MarR family transcriptional regulator